MRELLTDRESAKILGIKISQLYDTVDFFDKYDDDPWDLVEGEHFEFVQSMGDYQGRRFPRCLSNWKPKPVIGDCC